MNGFFVIVHKKLINGFNIIIFCNDEIIWQSTTLTNVITSSK